jgi:hypothetical protein
MRGGGMSDDERGGSKRGKRGSKRIKRVNQDSHDFQSYKQMSSTDLAMNISFVGVIELEQLSF